MSETKYTIINDKHYYVSHYIPCVPLIKEEESGFYNITQAYKHFNKRSPLNDNPQWFRELTTNILNKIYPNDDTKTYTDLHFTLNIKGSKFKDFNGLYIHELYLIPLLSKINNEVTLSVSNIYNRLRKDYNNARKQLQKHNNQIFELTTPINRSEESLIVITKLEDENLYSISNLRDRKTIINNDKILTIPYVNCDDVYNIFCQTLKKYQELDCVTKYKGREYIINDLDRFLNMINEIKYNTFDVVNYGIDVNNNINLAKQDIVNKILSGKYNKTCMVGLLYEHFCLDFLKSTNKHDDIHLWKFLPQTFINEYNINNSDYGKDIVDIKYKSIYQCKYYPNATLTLDELHTFISEAEKYNERGFESFLICPSSTTLSQMVEDKFAEFNIYVINYDAEDMLEFMKNNDIKLTHKIFNVMKYLENNITKSFDELLDDVRTYYKSDYKKETLKTMLLRLKKQNPELEIDFKTPIAKQRKDLVIKYYEKSDIEIHQIIIKETNESFNFRSVERIRRQLHQENPEKYKLPYRNSKTSEQINIRLTELVEKGLGTKKETEILQNEFPEFKLTEECIQDRKARLNLIQKIPKDNWDTQSKEIKTYIKEHSYLYNDQLQIALMDKFNLTESECRLDRIHGVRKQYVNYLKRNPIKEFDDKIMSDVSNYIKTNPHLQPHYYANQLKLNVNIIQQYVAEYNRINPNDELMIATKNRDDVYKFICKEPGETLEYYQNKTHAERLMVKKWAEKYNKEHPDSGTTIYNAKEAYKPLLAWMLMNPKLQPSEYKTKFKCKSMDPINDRLKKIDKMSEEEKQKEIEKYKNFNFDAI